jgi:hypothetical protein
MSIQRVSRGVFRTALSTTLVRKFPALLPIGVVLSATVTLGAGPQGATPWAVIKCKFSDQPQEPIFDPTFITGENGMAGYWGEMSYGQVSLDGTAIFGWYTMSHSLAQDRALTRQQRIDACIAAATDVDVSRFYGVIAILNAKIDSGAAGLGRVVLDPLAWFPTFAGHEMGHGYGLDHTFDDTGVVYDPGSDGRPGAYGDGWDIMSAQNFGNSNPTFPGTYGNSGPGLIAANLDKLGWMPADRILTWDGISETATLAALNLPLVPGYLMVKMPFDDANPNHYYTIEFRIKNDWDRGIPQDTVLIHEVRTDGLFYLIKANGGPQRLPGQTFHDVNNNVAITVLNIDSASERATVNIGMNDVWVDFRYSPFGFEDGTPPFPFNTMGEAVNAVGYNGTLHLATGSSAAAITISKPMILMAYNGPVVIGH